MKYLKEHAVSIIVIGVIGILSLAALTLDLSHVRESIAQAGAWAPVLYVMAKASTVIFAPLSGTALYIFSVPLFGFWPAVAYSLLGDFIGAVVTFYISRFFGQPVVKYFTGKKNMVHIENALEIMSTTKGFISMRLAAISMPEIASYAAGLTKINFGLFIFIHMAINIIPTIGLSLPGLLLQDGGDLPTWMKIGAILAAVLVTVVSVAIFVFMVKRASKNNTPTEAAKAFDELATDHLAKLE